MKSIITQGVIGIGIDVVEEEEAGEVRDQGLIV